MIVHDIKKYTSFDPLVAPDYYFPKTIVRALYVPYKISISPAVITDTVDNILSYVFEDRSVKVMYPHPYYHVCFDSQYQLLSTSANIVATTLLRQSFCMHLGHTVTDAVYGDVVFFGSYNYKDAQHDTESHSISYEITEQATRIYESMKCHFGPLQY